MPQYPSRSSIFDTSIAFATSISLPVSVVPTPWQNWQGYFPQILTKPCYIMKERKPVSDSSRMLLRYLNFLRNLLFSHELHVNWLPWSDSGWDVHRLVMWLEGWILWDAWLPAWWSLGWKASSEVSLTTWPWANQPCYIRLPNINFGL